MPVDRAKLHAALNILAKWRVHFAGWQLGTRVKGDPECDAVSDHREGTLLMRAEFNALTATLHQMYPEVKVGDKIIEEGFFAKFQENLLKEAEQQEKDLELRWPGVKATPLGLVYDKRAIDWMSKWRK